MSSQTITNITGDYYMGQETQESSLVSTPTNNTPTSFPRFNELAKELRLMIWSYAITERNPRLIEVVLRIPDPSVSREAKLCYRRADRPISGIFFANHESRTVALAYKGLEPLVLDGHRSGTLVNWEIDMIFISLGPWEAFYLGNFNCVEMIEKCRRLALTYDSRVLNVLQAQNSRTPPKAAFFSKFTQLNEVAMIEWGSYKVFCKIKGNGDLTGLTDLKITPVSELEEISMVGTGVAQAKRFLDFQARYWDIKVANIAVAQPRNPPDMLSSMKEYKDLRNRCMASVYQEMDEWD